MSIRPHHIAAVAFGVLASSAFAAPPTATDVASFDAPYRGAIQPLIKRYCYECHDDVDPEADVDLSRFRSIADIRGDAKTWVKVRKMLDTGQMPPRKSKQPTDDEHAQLAAWVRGYLTAEARSRAGDPGRVVLRRLSNAEYTYTVRDLTGVDTLDPTREFPVDGAAGEGFTNTGESLSMSPALVDKYLSAAKSIAEHTVFLPDGIRFSEHTSRRDQTDEMIAQIRAFYRAQSDDRGGSAVDLQGVRFETNKGGRLPIDRYLRATLAERDALTTGAKSIDQVAAEHKLSVKYLGAIWSALSAKDGASSTLLDAVRERWRTPTPNEPEIVRYIERWQGTLWKFNSVGDIGYADEANKPKSWQEAVTPIDAGHDLRLDMPKPNGEGDVVFYLAVGDAGDGNERDFAVWRRPHLEYRDKPAVMLRDVRGVAHGIVTVRAAELKRTAQYLAAAEEAFRSNAATEAIAKRQALDAVLLERWRAYLGLAPQAAPTLTGHFDQRITKARGYDAINGWGTKSDTPNMLTNRSNEPITFLTLTVPARSVTVHPSPTQEAIAAWRSPIDGRVRVEGHAADADDKCGNGAAWRVEHRGGSGTAVLAQGVFENGGRGAFKPDAVVDVRKGDLVCLVINARDRNHGCDTTEVSLTITDAADAERVWNMASDTVDRIGEGNPVADRYGNADTWHFVAEVGAKADRPTYAAGSTLALWRASVINEPEAAARHGELAAACQAVLMSDDPAKLSEADRATRAQLMDWRGPLQWAKATGGAADGGAADNPYGVDPALFGKGPDGAAMDENDLCIKAPQLIAVRLPAAIAEGATLVTGAQLHPDAGGESSVQFAASMAKPTLDDLSPDVPIVATNDGAARKRFEAAFGAFRDLFPAALCYVKIVPTDAVVTLTLYFREDDQLRRLVLNDAQTAELNRMWDELRFISQEPLQLATAYEQMIEFQTQGSNNSKKPEKKDDHPIMVHARAFREQLAKCEPAQLNGVLDFADRAWRRRATDAERDNLRNLYRELRASDIAHEDAIRLTLARVLTSPAFLYRLEQPAPGKVAEPVTGNELANRLSYFLWSSMPDDTLRALGDSGDITSDKVLLEQTHRLLRGDKTRRLAVHFALQWLHLRNFDQNNEKNEKLYPTFAEMRGPMHEEAVLFFEDMFRNDGSILDLLNADHTFLNEALAKHYGIPGVTGPEWRRVDGVRAYGRGGVLGMGVVLSSQSGASRTSPILRGNWVYETLLGERLPRPPANVPQIPDAAPPAGLTARQLIERHSSDPACAKCHKRIDPYGFALEQYDAIGRTRPRPVDTKTTLLDGKPLEGIDGLRDYLTTDRRDTIVTQFCRKLLGFALGRETQLSDEPLLAEMRERLEANGYRFSVAVDAIVTSPQFRRIRGVLQSDD
ncbi:MAG: DUF1592 domain-containing protein [Phycisphaera sp.]|nr:DUF1592 domain-containing protein [Phycisphaera sp.]